MQNKDDDHQFGGPLPDPSTRHWRHPSELSGLTVTAADSGDRGLSVGSLAAIGMFAFGGAAAILVVVSLAGVPAISNSGIGSSGNLSVDLTVDDLANDGANGADAGAALPLPESDADEDLTSFSHDGGDDQDDGAAETEPSPIFDEKVTDALAATGVFSQSNNRLASFVVIEGMAITSASALDGRTAVWLVFNEQWIEAEVIGSDLLTDVAVLQPLEWTEELAGMVVDMSEADVGQEVEIDPVVGQLNGDPPTVWTGAIGRLNDVAETGTGHTWYDALLMSMPASQSAPGSAVLSDSGHAVGMTIDSPAPLAVAVPFATVLEVAESLVSNGSASPAWIGIEATTDDHDETRLLTVDPSSPANDLLLPDDVVLTANGAAVESADHLVYLVRNSEIGADLDLVVDRGGDRHSATITIGVVPANQDR